MKKSIAILLMLAVCLACAGVANAATATNVSCTLVQDEFTVVMTLTADIPSSMTDYNFGMEFTGYYNSSKQTGTTMQTGTKAAGQTNTLTLKDSHMRPGVEYTWKGFVQDNANNNERTYATTSTITMHALTVSGSIMDGAAYAGLAADKDVVYQFHAPESRPYKVSLDSKCGVVTVFRTADMARVEEPIDIQNNNGKLSFEAVAGADYYICARPTQSDDTLRLDSTTYDAGYNQLSLGANENCQADVTQCFIAPVDGIYQFSVNTGVLKVFENYQWVTRQTVVQEMTAGQNLLIKAGNNGMTYTISVKQGPATCSAATGDGFIRTNGFALRVPVTISSNNTGLFYGVHFESTNAHHYGETGQTTTTIGTMQSTIVIPYVKPGTTYEYYALIQDTNSNIYKGVEKTITIPNFSAGEILTLGTQSSTAINPGQDFVFSFQSGSAGVYKAALSDNAGKFFVYDSQNRFIAESYSGSITFSADANTTYYVCAYAGRGNSLPTQTVIVQQDSSTQTITSAGTGISVPMDSIIHFTPTEEGYYTLSTNNYFGVNNLRYNIGHCEDGQEVSYSRTQQVYLKAGETYDFSLHQGSGQTMTSGQLDIEVQLPSASTYFNATYASYFNNFSTGISQVATALQNITVNSTSLVNAHNATVDYPSTPVSAAQYQGINLLCSSDGTVSLQAVFYGGSSFTDVAGNAYPSSVGSDGYTRVTLETGIAAVNFANSHTLIVDGEASQKLTVSVLSYAYKSLAENNAEAVLMKSLTNLYLAANNLQD